MPQWQIRQGNLDLANGFHAVCAIQRFTLVDREHHVALGQKHRLPSPLYQLPGVPVWHRRCGRCRRHRRRRRDLGRRRLPRARSKELRAWFSKLRTLRQCERDRCATACGPLDPVRIGGRCARRGCRALHPGGIKDDESQRPGKDRKQDRLSHRATHHDCSRATTSDRRLSTMKSGFRDSGSRLEPLLLDRVDVFPSFLPKQASTAPGSTPGLFFVGRSRSWNPIQAATLTILGVRL
jgi:hypothetical protein